LTGQITHHIAADIDRERDLTIADFNRVQQISSLYQVTGVGATWDSRNGGGDRYYTDGELTIALLSSDNLSNPKVPVQALNPPAIQLKQQIWQWIKRLL
jgi:LssY C-terminus